DTSTFHTNPDGTITDQPTRSPGARFWIPSFDEWVKGGYYDPDRYGEGEPGYWLHPGRSQTPLVSGLPWEGGETNGGVDLLVSHDPARNVGSYPHVRSAWGLMDISGGATEWIEQLSVDRW